MKRFSCLHVANTEFELELTGRKMMEPFSFHHPIAIQLQCLPFLFAEPNDGIVVKGVFPAEYFQRLVEIGLPDFSDKTVAPDSDIQCGSVHSWGMSRSLAAWAGKKGLPYEMPPWEAVREVNSKLFSYNLLPNFENSRLIENKRDLSKWLEGIKDKGVLKTAYGFSGKGKVIVDDSLPFERLSSFCEKEWSLGRPLIAESWLPKQLDFSSHWVVGKTGARFLGLTRIMNDAFGAYRGTVAGPSLDIPLAGEHLRIAEKAIDAIRQAGYFGSVGLDAMIYGGGKLHPLVEINARQTMSQVALKFQQRLFPEKNIRFDFASQGQDKNCLLPNRIINFDQKEIKFNKQFYFEVVS